MGEVGKGITSFKKGVSEGKAEIENVDSELSMDAREINPKKDEV
jgi:sec-independent protein translocase protein TatA